MAYQPMTVDEYHRRMSCGHSHPFVADILGVCPRFAEQETGITISSKTIPNLKTYIICQKSRP